MQYRDVTTLTAEDFEGVPAWHFCGDDESEFGELAVLPVRSVAETGRMCIVKASFQDAIGNSYSGFLTWDSTRLPSRLQPTIFFPVSDLPVFTLYFGSFEPSDLDFRQASSLLGPTSFPIRYRSEAVYDLYSLEGELHGFYWFQNGEVVCKPFPD